MFGLDKEAVTCSFLSNKGKHLVLLGLSGVNNVMTTFKNDDQGNVMLRVSSGHVVILQLKFVGSQ